MTYEARADTIAARAVDYLRREAGIWVSTEQLCEHLEKSSSVVNTSLRAAVLHGVVERQRDPRIGHRVQWRSRVPRDDETDQTDEDKPIQRTVRAPAHDPKLVAAARMRSAFDLAPRLRIVAEPKREPKACFALWSDGTLEIRRESEVLARLSLEETRELMDYLDGVRRSWKESSHA